MAATAAAAEFSGHANIRGAIVNSVATAAPYPGHSRSGSFGAAA
jgi:hypothetical protein